MRSGRYPKHVGWLLFGVISSSDSEIVVKLIGIDDSLSSMKLLKPLFDSLARTRYFLRHAFFFFNVSAAMSVAVFDKFGYHINGKPSIRLQ